MNLVLIGDKMFQKYYSIDLFLRQVILSVMIVLICVSIGYSQSLSSVSIKNDYSLIDYNAHTANSTISINTSFVYVLNHLKENTNELGFALDLQINQTNYVSWLLGINMSFYKTYSATETYNVSTFNSLIGPKFYFNKDKLSAYFRISTGMTYFSEYTSIGGQGWNLSIFPAFGLEYTISRSFRISFEPNMNLSLLGDMMFQGNFSLKTGIITAIY